VISQDSICRGAKGKVKAPGWQFGGNLAQMKRPPLSKSASTLPQCGPGSYGANDGLGTQVASTKKTAAVAKFSTADRVKGQIAVSPGYAGVSTGVTDNPGPGTYDGTSAVGRQADAKKPSSYSYSFGTEKRDTLGTGKSAANPGPGAYAENPGQGSQPNSKYRTSQRALFGTAARTSPMNAVG
jgi:hypothetical protein